MIKFIIGLIIDSIFKMIGAEKEKSAESENESLKGRINSVEDSFEEQEKAKKESEEAANNANNGSCSDDVFGSEEWNKNEEN